MVFGIVFSALGLNFFTSSLQVQQTIMPKSLVNNNTSTTVLLSFATCRLTLKKQPKRHSSVKVSAISYQNFIDFALDETKRQTHLQTSSLQGRYNSMVSIDGSVELQMQSFHAPKIRLLRTLSIETETMQVLDFGVFPRPEYDLPIFCANIFSNASTNIVLLDLNPLHDVITQTYYKQKYYKSLLPLGVKYAELLPWGGKLTSESLNFFSPIVLWTRFAPNQDKYSVLYSAFVDYYMAWLKLVDVADEEKDESRILFNREAQHRYLTWRAEKDPGHGILKRLIGDVAAKDLLRNFLFDGLTELGSKSFVDYFPEYRSEDGTVIERRSMVGKSYEHRPWNARGEFIGDDSTR